MKTVETETGNCKKYTFCRWRDSYRIWHLFAIPYEDYRAVPHTYSRMGEKMGITLEVGEMEIREVVKVVREKTEEEYTEELSGKLEEYIASLAKKAIQIKGKNVRIKKNANTVTLTGTLRVQGPFVERKETKVQEEPFDDTADE